MTFIPLASGFAYVVAIMDVVRCEIVAWRLSNTQSARFCVDALCEVITHFGPLEVFPVTGVARVDSTGRRNTSLEVGDGTTEGLGFEADLEAVHAVAGPAGPAEGG
mgnify:CR=1 FL=1